MSYNLIEIPKLINKVKVWEAKKAQWLVKQGTTFGNFNQEHYVKVKSAREGRGI